MVLKELAFRVINDPESFLLIDEIEAYQFVNDNGYVNDLSPKQQEKLVYFVEAGMVYSPEVRL